MTNPIEWLQNARKLDAGLLSAMGVKAVAHPSLGSVAAFPYKRNGEGYAAKFRTVDKRFTSTSNVSRGIYNEDDLRRLKELPIVITEGEIDCLSVMQSGFERAVSVPNGWTATGNSTEPLVAVADLLRDSPYVIVAGDNDESGESMPRAIANILNGHDVRTVQWPDGCKDANDVLVQHGEGAVAACLNSARRIDPPGGFITGFSDLPPMSERRVLRMDIYPFDQIVAFELGSLSVWTGIPGSGKSTFLAWAAHRVAVSENIRVGMFAFETHPHALRDQMSMIRTGRKFADLGGKDRADLLNTLDQRFRIVHRVFDDSAVHRLGWLETMIETLAVRDGCKLIVIDPWNELEHMPEPGETMTAYINWATQRLRQIAERLEVHIALVAHPKKMAEGHRAPNGYDVADSAAFFNKPSLGVTVHQREADDGESYVELSVWKVRNVQLYGFGRGVRAVNFDTATMQYSRRHR